MSNVLSYGTCFGIISKVKLLDPMEEKKIEIKFNPSIPLKSLPSEIKFFITSLENDYGIYLNKWLDGKVLQMEIGRNYYRKEIALKAEKYDYLKSITQCNDFSFAECFLMYRLNEDFKECPKNCTLINFLNHTLDLKNDFDDVKGKDENKYITIFYTKKVNFRVLYK